MRHSGEPGAQTLALAARDADGSSSAAVLRDALVGGDRNSRPDGAGSCDPEP